MAPPELKMYMRERFFTPKVFGKIWRLHQRPMWWALDKYRHLRDFLRLPDYRGTYFTPRRLLNLYLVRYQKSRGHVKLYGSPIVLTIESTNACNLRCPYCFTGAGEIGRDKTMLGLPLYQKALDEMGSRLLQVEFYNWGEPLLNKGIYDMVSMASDRGISTVISTNFSFPFDQERAEKLVASELKELGVSLDGAWQETYEQYRVRGDLETVLRNVRMVNDAKAKLGSKYPHMIWEYHIFPHNNTEEEIEAARRKAQELGMEFALSKGWVAGEDWDKTNEFLHLFPGGKQTPGHCYFLWQQAVINSEGGVAPCCGAYYKEDDFGVFGGEVSVPLAALASSSFRQIWNNEQFRAARELFRDRAKASAMATSLICYDCPVTVVFDRYKQHRTKGLSQESFESGFNPVDGFNYFFDRKPARPQRTGVGDGSADVIELTPTTNR